MSGRVWQDEIGHDLIIIEAEEQHMGFIKFVLVFISI